MSDVPPKILVDEALLNKTFEVAKKVLQGRTRNISRTDMLDFQQRMNALIEHALLPNCEDR